MSLKNDLEEKIKGLSLEGVDLILISDKYVFDRTKTLKLPEGLKKPIQIMYVENMGSLKALSIRDMRKAGWERVETLEKLAEKQKAKEAANG
jgi:hypothetical protein